MPLTSTFSTIAATQTAADKPLDTTLMDALRQDIDVLYEWMGGPIYTPSTSHNHNGVNSALVSLGSSSITLTMLELNSRPLGSGQDWTNVTASRAANTSYQNTTGRTIAVCINAGSSGGVSQDSGFDVSTNGTTWLNVVYRAVDPGATFRQIEPFVCLVPSSQYYRYGINAGGPISSWLELR